MLKKNLFNIKNHFNSNLIRSTKHFEPTTLRCSRNVFAFYHKTIESAAPRAHYCPLPSRRSETEVNGSSIERVGPKSYGHQQPALGQLWVHNIPSDRADVVSIRRTHFAIYGIRGTSNQKWRAQRNAIRASAINRQRAKLAACEVGRIVFLFLRNQSLWVI